MRLRNKCTRIKIQTADGTITPVMSLFYANPCKYFKEDAFIFTAGVVMDPWTHQVLAASPPPITLHCVYGEGENPGVTAVEIMTNAENRDHIIECVGSTLVGFHEQMAQRLQIPNDISCALE